MAFTVNHLVAILRFQVLVTNRLFEKIFRILEPLLYIKAMFECLVSVLTSQSTVMGYVQMVS